MQALRTWFDALSARERRTVLIGAALCALVLLLGGLLPLERRVAAAQANVDRQQADLAWLGSLGSRLAQLASSARAHGSGESLVVMVDRVAREQGIAGQLAGSQPAGDGSLSVRFQQVPFDALAAWAAALAQRAGARYLSASIEGGGGAGLVNATFVLRGP